MRPQSTDSVILRITYTEMRTRVITVLAMLSLLSGCEWVLTAVRTGVDVGVMLAADRSLLNVADDYSIKLEITSGLFDEALSLNVSTDVYQGMVMLTGAVKEEKDKQKAEKIARQAAEASVNSSMRYRSRPRRA